MNNFVTYPKSLRIIANQTQNRQNGNTGRKTL